MPVSEAKKKANLKWDQAHRADYWRCTIVFPIQEKERVIEQARSAGLSISDYVRQLIDNDKRE